MNIENIMAIEVEALSKTISRYTNNTYIRSYAEQLTSIDYPKDSDKLKLLSDRLIEWYDSEITRIRESEYVVDKESHLKSYELLLNIQEML